jgi:hypothetical protein
MPLNGDSIKYRRRLYNLPTELQLNTEAMLSEAMTRFLSMTDNEVDACIDVCIDSLETNDEKKLAALLRNMAYQFEYFANLIEFYS